MSPLCPSYPLGGCSQQAHCKHPAFSHLLASSTPLSSYRESCPLSRISGQAPFLNRAHGGVVCSTLLENLLVLCVSSAVGRQAMSLTSQLGCQASHMVPMALATACSACVYPSTPDSHEVKSISLICLCFYQIIPQHVFNKPLLPIFSTPPSSGFQIDSWLSFANILFWPRPHMG